MKLKDISRFHLLFLGSDAIWVINEVSGLAVLIITHIASLPISELFGDMEI
jgi:hypothetical protein